MMSRNDFNLYRIDLYQTTVNQEMFSPNVVKGLMTISDNQINNVASVRTLVCLKRLLKSSKPSFNTGSRRLIELDLFTDLARAASPQFVSGTRLTCPLSRRSDMNTEYLEYSSLDL